MIGETIAHYRVTEKIGAGGMGEVYRATDSKLNRDVALKVLPEMFSRDADRMARFSREAQVLASLNHPNIASIYGLEESEGKRALVLELVEGPTLGERMRSGAFSIEEALGIARQIAEALEAAHEQGVIHRDLKPANVKVKEDGFVKVLDFGLAKAMEDDPSSGDMANSPTLSIAATKAGVILGTAAYMSPEQARGAKVDKRSDIWAFGVVLFEMLTGESMFQSETVSDTLAAVLKGELDLKKLPADTPAGIQKLLRRCLERDRNRRLRDIGDVKMEIEEVLAGPDDEAVLEEASSQTAQPASSFPLMWMVAVAVNVVVIGLLVWRPWYSESPVTPMRLQVEVTAEEQLYADFGAAAVLSPDGKMLAYVIGTLSSRMLYLRSLNQLEGSALSGTEGARNPFFSPDGEWIGFFTDNTLKKVSISGGAPLTLASTGDNRGGTWNREGTIVFSSNITTGLSKISESGGDPVEITTREQGVRSHRWPSFLSDGKHVIFMAQGEGDSYDDSSLAVVNLESGDTKMVHEGGTYPRYISTGHITYVRDGTLFAAPFDLGALEVTGPPAPLIEGVLFSGNSNAGNGGAQYAFSQNGSLVYLPGITEAREFPIVQADREGKSSSLFLEKRNFSSPRLSPDGKFLALHINTASNSDVWVLEIARGTLTRLTFAGNNNGTPAWTPDGQRIAFYSTRGDGTQQLFWKRADGGGVAEKLTDGDHTKVTGSISPDGKFLAFFQDDPENSWDLWTVSLEGDQKAEAFLSTPAVEVWPEFSPDGKWIAYLSNESGQFEVYVRPFPGPGGKWQVSTGGGGVMRWSKNGKELIYRSGNKWMSVEVSALGDSFRAGKPVELFEEPFINLNPFPAYDVSRDGRRFVMFKADDDSPEVRRTHLTLILNWFEEVRRLSSAGRD